MMVASSTLFMTSPHVEIERRFRILHASRKFPRSSRSSLARRRVTHQLRARVATIMSAAFPQRDILVLVCACLQEDNARNNFRLSAQPIALVFHPSSSPD